MTSTRPLCEVSACERPASSRADDLRVCLLHYKRWKRHGTFAAGRPWSPPNPVKRKCCAEGCTQLEDGSCGMCKLHDTRRRRHGDPAVKLSPGALERAHWKGDDASYTAVHRRLAVRRGPARDYPCAECGAPALHWAYDHLDTAEKPSAQGPFSTDLSHYRPMCVPCHKTADLQAIAERAVA